MSVPLPQLRNSITVSKYSGKGRVEPPTTGSPMSLGAVTKALLVMYTLAALSRSRHYKKA